jgi:hypothetical protein
MQSMKRTRLVGITRTSEVSFLGSSDQRKINSIRRITKSDPSLAEVFAEPILDANGESISWYTDIPGSISAFNELSSSEKRFLEKSWKIVREKLKALREPLDAADRVILDNIIETPGVEALHLVGHQLLVTDWSSVRLGYRPKNKNIGIDLDPEPIVPDHTTEVPEVEEPVDTQKSDIGAQSAYNASNLDTEIEQNSAGQTLEVAGDPIEEKSLPKPKISFFYSLWFWASLFLVLCVLNWFLLIDACGVEGIQFLNFCR